MNAQSPGDSHAVSQQIFGWLAVFGSALLFYLTTLIIHWSSSRVDIAVSYFVFARFLLGFAIVVLAMMLRRQQLRPKKYHYLIGRTVANTIAVFCFYKSVELGTVAEGNILNMTYPLFVALFSWFFLREHRDVLSLIIVGLAFVGIWLVLAPGDIRVRIENLWGLSSGIMAAAAIVYLNISRRYHDSQTILFFVFGPGALLILIFFHDTIFWPNALELFFLLTCSFAGVLGQYLLTYGFFYVTAVEGSIISSSRLLIAALLGPFLTAEPSLNLVGWLGALLILGANVALAIKRK